jgi:hypothetical protein
VSGVYLAPQLLMIIAATTPQANNDKTDFFMIDILIV